MWLQVKNGQSQMNSNISPREERMKMLQENLPQTQPVSKDKIKSDMPRFKMQKEAWTVIHNGMRVQMIAVVQELTKPEFTDACGSRNLRKKQRGRN